MKNANNIDELLKQSERKPIPLSDEDKARMWNKIQYTLHQKKMRTHKKLFPFLSVSFSMVVVLAAIILVDTQPSTIEQTHSSALPNNVYSKQIFGSGGVLLPTNNWNISTTIALSNNVPSPIPTLRIAHIQQEKAQQILANTFDITDITAKYDTQKNDVAIVSNAPKKFLKAFPHGSCIAYSYAYVELQGNDRTIDTCATITATGDISMSQTDIMASREATTQAKRIIASIFKIQEDQLIIEKTAGNMQTGSQEFDIILPTNYEYAIPFVPQPWHAASDGDKLRALSGTLVQIEGETTDTIAVISQQEAYDRLRTDLENHTGNGTDLFHTQILHTTGDTDINQLPNARIEIDELELIYVPTDTNTLLPYYVAVGTILDSGDSIWIAIDSSKDANFSKEIQLYP